jgi:hypothetical protein
MLFNGDVEEAFYFSCVEARKGIGAFVYRASYTDSINNSQIFWDVSSNPNDRWFEFFSGFIDTLDPDVQWREYFLAQSKLGELYGWGMRGREKTDAERYTFFSNGTVLDTKDSSTSTAAIDFDIGTVEGFNINSGDFDTPVNNMIIDPPLASPQLILEYSLDHLFDNIDISDPTDMWPLSF